MVTRRSPGRALKLVRDTTTERRTAPRLGADDVPWITTVKPSLGESATLVDISRTGLLIETPDRLLPGQRKAVILGLAAGPAERVEGTVVHANLVTISKAGLLYRTGFRFSEELAEYLLRPPQTLSETPDSTPDRPASPDWSARLEGPLDGLWSTGGEWSLTTVTALTETGCQVHLVDPVEVGTSVALTVFFTMFRRLMLAGQVVERLAEGGCLVRFTKLSAEQRRSLRVELRSPSQTGPAPAFTLEQYPPVGRLDVAGYMDSMKASGW